MTIDINIKCDECNETLENDDKVFCYKCFKEYAEKIEELEEQVEELEKEVAQVRSEVEDEEYEKLESKYEELTIDYGQLERSLEKTQIVDESV